MELKESVVLFPTVGMGHLIPMVELAKLFDAHGFSVTVAVVDPPFDTSSTIDPFFLRASSANPSIHFHRLPKITSSKDTTSYHFDTLRQASAHLLHFLRSGKPTLNNIRALVLDMFCFPGLDVAEELGVPSYFFFPSGAIALAAFLALPTLQSKLKEGSSFRDNFGDGAAKVDLPGLPPISVVDLPDDIPDRTDVNKELLSNLEHLWRADGFIVNTFEWLEKRAVEALKDGTCVPGRRNPPVYCIGPLNKGGDGSTGEITMRHECLEWLDAQPEKSVVFLCFGSNGFPPVEQIREIAVGLERSGQRFLWVARSRHNEEKEVLEAIFVRDGFLERTRGRGMVARSWVPQDLVLAHGSVGAFVSHCGWNSSMEAVAAGIPVVAWPRGAEQRMNKVLLVEEAKVAVAVEGYEKGVVRAEEVERKVRWLMESEEGKVVRDRAAEAKEEAAAARKGDGSSTLAWLEVVNSLRKYS